MAVTVYLMRHGIAAEPSRETRDADRALTPEGIRKTMRVAVGLRALNVRPELILSSPLRRAEETARLVAEALGPSPAVEIYSPLAAGAAPKTVLGNLPRMRGLHQLLLVGHQPDLGRLASYLMTGSAELAPLPFKKASVAALSMDALPPRSTALLEWFLAPTHLRAIAEGRK